MRHNETNKGSDSFTSAGICNYAHIKRQLMELFGFNPYAIDQSSVNCAQHSTLPAVCFVQKITRVSRRLELIVGSHAECAEAATAKVAAFQLIAGAFHRTATRMQIEECVLFVCRAHRTLTGGCCMHRLIRAQPTNEQTLGSRCRVCVCASVRASPAASDAGAAH
jgi:hypothetical protein